MDRISSKTAIPDAAEIAIQLSHPVRLKTWSLIVTVFGDAVMPYGGTIYATELNRILEEMGIKGGAVRTALSRLASDGFIERAREGRASRYRLAKSREIEFERAARKIYASSVQPVHERDFVLVSAGGSGQAFAEGGIRLSREWWLVEAKAGRQQFSEDAAVFSGTFEQLPDWMIARLASPEMAAAMNQLLDIGAPILAAIRQGQPVAPLQALAIRCLIIHAWRRIVLKLRLLPSAYCPDNWPENQCRQMVAELYGLLSPIAEPWLREAITEKSGMAALPKRFL